MADCTVTHLLASHKWVVRYGFCECGYECDAHEWVRHVAVLTATLASPCASGWGETPALLTFALHGARTDQY